MPLRSHRPSRHGDNHNADAKCAERGRRHAPAPPPPVADAPTIAPTKSQWQRPPFRHFEIAVAALGAFGLDSASAVAAGEIELTAHFATSSARSVSPFAMASPAVRPSRQKPAPPACRSTRAAAISAEVHLEFRAPLGAFRIGIALVAIWLAESNGLLRPARKNVCRTGVASASRTHRIRRHHRARTRLFRALPTRHIDRRWHRHGDANAALHSCRRFLSAAGVAFN